MGNMRFEVGDRVRIKSIDWYNENKDANNGVRCGNFTFYAAQYCGFTVTIALVNVNAGCYIMKEIDDVWTDEMIEELVEEGTKSENGLLDEYEELTDRAFKGGYEKCKSDIELNGFLLPEGYIFKDENGNVINATKIVLEKEKEYPKSYEECCEVLGINSENFLSTRNVHRYDGEEETIKYERDLLDKFDYLWQLIICRDAYWKIAGEEMGLGKPWEPDYNSLKTKYTIEVIENKVVVISTISENHILAFPTEEMRDAFYENFKELIEFCKEFL